MTLLWGLPRRGWDGKGNFKVFRGNQSGFLVDTDAKALAELNLANGQSIYLVTSNSDSLEAFSQIQPNRRDTFSPEPLDVSAIITLQDGRKYRHEFYFGSSYLSQSSRTLKLIDKVDSLVITNNHGGKRYISRPIKSLL